MNGMLQGFPSAFFVRKICGFWWDIATAKLTQYGCSATASAVCRLFTRRCWPETVVAERSFVTHPKNCSDRLNLYKSCFKFWYSIIYRKLNGVSTKNVKMHLNFLVLASSPLSSPLSLSTKTIILFLFFGKIFHLGCRACSWKSGSFDAFQPVYRGEHRYFVWRARLEPGYGEM